MKALPFKIPKVENSSFHLQTDKEPYFYDKLHQHPELQLVWIERGEGTLIFGDFLGEFHSGELYLIGSDVPHVFRSKAEYYLPGTPGILARTIFFKPELVFKGSSVLPELGQLKDLVNWAERGLRIESGKAEGIIRMMLEVFESDSLTRLGKIICLLGELKKTDHQTLSQLPMKSINEHQGRRLDDVFKFTMENYNRPITLDEVAEVVHMNKAAFCRYFKQHTRKTFLNFLNEIRLQKASELLRNSEFSVAQIAFDVGFNNLSNFNRTFKLYKGTTPHELRSDFRVDLQ